MKKLLLECALMVSIVASGAAAVEACGSKFLVGGRSSPRFARVLASIQPTKILFLWEQNDATAEEDRWNSNLEDLLTSEEVGHTVTVTFDEDAFRKAAQSGEFDVVVATVEMARQVQATVESVLPNAAFLVFAHLPTRSVLKEIKKEFGEDNVLKTPNTTDAFLSAIERSRRSVE